MLVLVLSIFGTPELRFRMRPPRRAGEVEHSLMAQALLFTILSFVPRVQIRSWSPKGYNCVLMIRDSGGEVGAPSAESAHTVENRIMIG